MYVKGVCGEYKRWGKKRMYGVNELNMDTHEHLVNLNANIKVKLKSVVPLTIENTWCCIFKVKYSGALSIL